MGIFDSIFGNSDGEKKGEKKSIPWIPLHTVGQLTEVKDNSTKVPQIIFKHSTTCGISRMALKMFEANYSLQEGQVAMYYLDLLAHRDVSNAVATAFEVTHQSPQILIIKNGVVVHHDSHGAIADIKLEKYL